MSNMKNVAKCEIEPSHSQLTNSKVLKKQNDYRIRSITTQGAYQSHFSGRLLKP